LAQIIIGEFGRRSEAERAGAQRMTGNDLEEAPAPDEDEEEHVAEPAAAKWRRRGRLRSRHRRRLVRVTSMGPPVEFEAADRATATHWRKWEVFWENFQEKRVSGSQTFETYK
jgi:hypothetical protein